MADITPRPGLSIALPDMPPTPLHARLDACGSDAQALLTTFEDICAERFGVMLFTVLQWDPSRDEIQRVHSNDPDHYPMGVWKPMGPTPWGAELLKAGRAVLCHDEAELRWAFPDADLLVRLDCVANLSAPVCQNGRVLGVASISNVSGHYMSNDLALYATLVQYLVPVFSKTSL
ncbi:GAF domain-containing protein [Falsirhodobacter sp. 1013]|uniref:GAF domain-containing protein n=1 Tax=Falsirhodobacter sp. 1013 TaxID=3417566 RepID=UPI003EBE816E